MRMFITALPLAAALLALPLLSGASSLAAGETAADVLARAEARYGELEDYECTVEAAAQNGKKRESGVYRFWFKKPAMMRLHVTGGKSRGSDLAIDEKGRIRGRKGGLLKPFVISLSRNDKRLRNLRGYPVWELEWGAFYRKLRERAARPSAQLTLSPRSGTQPYELVLRYVDQGKQMREMYRIDAVNRVLLQADFYEDNERVDHLVFRDIQLNPGLKPNFFRL